MWVEAAAVLGLMAWSAQALHIGKQEACPCAALSAFNYVVNNSSRHSKPFA
jgi:hypothetical protein